MLVWNRSNQFDAVFLNFGDNIFVSELSKIFTELKYLKSDMDSNGEWLQICQKILRSQTSMDFGEFLEFLQFLRGRRKKENSEGEDKEDIECLDRFIQKIEPIVEETLLEIKTYDKMGFDRPWLLFIPMTHFTIIIFFRLVYVHKGMSVQNMEPSAEQFRIASLLDEKKFDAGMR